MLFQRIALLALCCAVLTGCELLQPKSSETAGADAVTANVGIYPPPPAGIDRPRVGVPPFKVSENALRGGKFEDIAADQSTTLLIRSRRFKVIERTQLTQLLDEQDLEGIVQGGELARMGQVRGVDYLLIGKVDSFRVKEENTGGGFNLKLPFDVLGKRQKVGYDSDSRSITFECGVDLRLVDPENGEVVAAMFSDYKKTDSMSGMGFTALGAKVDSGGSFNISQDNYGKLLRLALDDAIRKMLPQVDDVLVAQLDAKEQASPAGDDKTDGGTGGAFCSNCGQKHGPDVKFCANCGKKTNE